MKSRQAFQSLSKKKTMRVIPKRISQMKSEYCQIQSMANKFLFPTVKMKSSREYRQSSLQIQEGEKIPISDFQRKNSSKTFIQQISQSLIEEYCSKTNKMMNFKNKLSSFHNFLEQEIDGKIQKNTQQLLKGNFMDYKMDSFKQKIKKEIFQLTFNLMKVKSKHSNIFSNSKQNFKQPSSSKKKFFEKTNRKKFQQIPNIGEEDSCIPQLLLRRINKSKQQRKFHGRKYKNSLLSTKNYFQIQNIFNLTVQKKKPLTNSFMINVEVK